MTYLNNAATTFPKPEEVKKAIVYSIDNLSSSGRGSGSAILNTDSLLDRTRSKIAKLFNVKDHRRVVFTQNCTEALNYAIKGVLCEGDHVIMDNTCHNSLARPLITLEKEGVIALSKINPKEDFKFDLNEIKELIDERTKLVAISHASNVFGSIQDVKFIGEIVRDTKAYFLVDAAQSAGQIEIDVSDFNIDLLGVAGHKGLFGPTGTGVLYVSEKVVELKTIKEGGTGNKSEDLDQPSEFPHVLETGTHNVLGIAGLEAGVDFILKTGVNSIREHELKLMEDLYSGVKNIGGIKLYGSNDLKSSTSVLSFTLEGYDVSDLGVILNDSFGIVTRSGLHCASLAHEFLGTLKTGGTLRVSPGYFNTESDIDKFVKALYEIAS